jgi:adenylate cyclase
MPVKLSSRDLGQRVDVEPPAQPTSIDVIASALEPMTPTIGRLSSPDGALTLMLSDIADAASLAPQLGEARWEQVLDDHHLLIERLIDLHEGHVVRFVRDGFLASFNSAHAGLHAAVELQRTFTGGQDDAAAHDLRLRIGLHSGFVIGDEGDLLGRNVVLASRIAAYAAAGEILVSSMLKQYTESDPSFRFEDRGEHHFKGLLGEHAVYAVAWR